MKNTSKAKADPGSKRVARFLAVVPELALVVAKLTEAEFRTVEAAMHALADAMRPRIAARTLALADYCGRQALSCSGLGLAEDTREGGWRCRRCSAPVSLKNSKPGWWVCSKGCNDTRANRRKVDSDGREEAKRRASLGLVGGAVGGVR